MSGFAHFDLQPLALDFPETADTMLVDRYLTDAPEASTRMFRAYRSTPAHFHRNCDERLLVIRGRGSFWAGDPQQQIAFEPGTLLVFARGTVHAMPTILEHPVVFLAIDIPRRDPSDVHFVDPAAGSAATFIQQR